MAGRHNASKGMTDPTYSYDRFAPSHQGPRPCYGRSNGAKMTVHRWREIVRNDPSAFGVKVDISKDLPLEDTAQT